MYEKIEYRTYKGCKDILTFDLHNGYTVIALKAWNPDESKYHVELRLKNNTVEKWDLIEKADDVIFEDDYKTINRSLLKYVSTLLSDGFFNYYIDRLKYDMRCFDIGNTVMEDGKCILSLD